VLSCIRAFMDDKLDDKDWWLTMLLAIGRDGRWAAHPATARLLPDLYEPCAGHENVPTQELLGLRPPVLCSVLATFLLNAGTFAHSRAPPRARLIGALLLGVRRHARQRRCAKVCLEGTSHGCGAGSEARGV